MRLGYDSDKTQSLLFVLTCSKSKKITCPAVISFIPFKFGLLLYWISFRYALIQNIIEIDSKTLNRLFVCLAGWLVGWLVGRMLGWLHGWLVGLPSTLI